MGIVYSSDNILLHFILIPWYAFPLFAIRVTGSVYWGHRINATWVIISINECPHLICKYHYVFVCHHWSCSIHYTIVIYARIVATTNTNIFKRVLKQWIQCWLLISMVQWHSWRGGAIPLGRQSLKTASMSFSLKSHKERCIKPIATISYRVNIASFCLPYFTSFFNW